MRSQAVEAKEAKGRRRKSKGEEERDAEGAFYSFYLPISVHLAGRNKLE